MNEEDWIEITTFSDLAVGRKVFIEKITGETKIEPIIQEDDLFFGKPSTATP